MLYTFVLLVSFVSVAFSATVPTTPYIDTQSFADWSGRIVGGQTAHPGQFPYQASLRTVGNFHFCGASIVSNRWVVSAAHCTENDTPATVRVVVGAHNRIVGGTNMVVSRVVNHPSWNSNLLINDISMVQTQANILFTGSVSAISIGTTAEIGGGVPAVASGWGQTSHPGNAAENLQFLNVNILTNAVCRSRHNPVNALSVHANTICSFGAVGNGMCMGDSGGPLVAHGQLAGAVSWGVPCGVGAPDVFARISSHHGWIVSVLNS